MSNTIDVALGEAPEVYQLFSYANPGLALTDVISHGFNQTLERDMFFGSWADAYIHDNGEYRVKITSPTHDVSVYGELIKNYLAAGRNALAVYNQKVLNTKGFQFLLPFGLAMANVKSVQLFHFPPDETFYYSDYLYSPTNRRWECLLVQNEFDGKYNSLVERIIDVVPIAAGGGAGDEIKPYNNAFLEYGEMQLKTFLDGSSEITQPVVAMGDPVRDWLWTAYGDQIEAQINSKSGDNPLGVLSLLTLEIKDGARTPVLCANHPSMYLYDTDKPVPNGSTTTKQKGEYPPPITVMRQDLIAAGWQAAMQANFLADPSETLTTMIDRWASDEKVEAIMREQNTEFSYAK